MTNGRRRGTNETLGVRTFTLRDGSLDRSRVEVHRSATTRLALAEIEEIASFDEFADVCGRQRRRARLNGSAARSDDGERLRLIPAWSLACALYWADRLR